MNYLLKIVQGANAGAEIALAEGVVTFGSSDSCDIVLSDSSLPDEAFALETSAAGVSLKELPNGEAKNVEPYTLFTFGNSTFAIGENGAAWPELKSPAPPPAPEPPPESPEPSPAEPSPPPEPPPPPGAAPARNRLPVRVGARYPLFRRRIFPGAPVRPVLGILHWRKRRIAVGRAGERPFRWGR